MAIGPDVRKSYPCFSPQAVRPQSMALRLSTACNMHCRYCFKGSGVPGIGDRAGIGTTVMTVAEALSSVDARFRGGRPPASIELTGPGEPLLDAATYAVLRRLHATHPGTGLSVWTNGVLLPDRLEELVRSGVRGITLSLNALSIDTAEALYEWVIYRGRRHTGRDAAHLVVQQQWTGLANAVEAGLDVTVFLLEIPGVNGHDRMRIEEKAREIGAERCVVVR